jgi:hypothetical protein
MRRTNTSTCRTCRFAIALLAGAVGFGFLTSSSFAQYGGSDKKDPHAGHGDHKPAAPGGEMGGMPDMSKMTPEEQAMMKRWMEYMTPGPAHQRMIKAFSGKWNAECTMWEPGKPPQTSQGSMTNMPMLGDRYIHHMFKGSMMGMPFEGAGTMGYDNAQKKYVGTWMDSMGTSTMVMTGDYNEAKKQYTMTGEMPDCSKEGMPMAKYKEVITVTDDDHHAMEMWGPGPDGKEMKMMEIKYTRAK